MKIHLASEVSGSTESHQENWDGVCGMCVYNHIYNYLDSRPCKGPTNSTSLGRFRYPHFGSSLYNLHQPHWVPGRPKPFRLVLCSFGELLPRGCQINAIAVEWFLVVPKKNSQHFRRSWGEQVENKQENSAQIFMLFHHLTFLGFCIEFLSAIVFLMETEMNRTWKASFSASTTKTLGGVAPLVDFSQAEPWEEFFSSTGGANSHIKVGGFGKDDWTNNHKDVLLTQKLVGGFNPSEKY